jgi:amino acid adenylation domain-containing protein
MTPTEDPRTLESLVRERVRRHPDRPAVVDAGRVLTYGELDRRVDTVAAGLQAAGVRRGDLVAVFLSRTADLVAALLATHRLGAAYVPLDPDYPSERLDFMVADSRPRALLADARTAGAARRFAGPALVEVDRLPAAAPVDPEPPAPADVAYVIYTSGSTGRPKGVLLEHRNTVGMLDWVHTEFGEADLAGVLLGTSVCFDLSVFEVFGTLTGGGTIVVAPNALALPELPDRDRVTLLNTVPGVTAALVRAGDLPPSVRIVIHSGDTTTRALADAVLAVPTVERLYNLYGPTEVVTWQAGARLRRGDPGEPPLGVPFPGVGAHVLDPAGRPVPAGTVGELWLSGRQVSRGYLGRPELTAERFVDRPEGRSYRTGDLVVRDEAGVLHYRGRTDFQVKVRGYRVELGEIEAALERDRRVQDCVALAPAGPSGERRVVAYVQVGGHQPDPDGLCRGPALDALAGELTALVRGVLPDYMVPAGYGFLAALPTTPNGKPDRAALPAVRLDAAGRAPAGPAEEAVAGVWREVLGLAEVPADVPFGALGGDSLLAAGVTARLRRLGAAVTLPEFHADPTVAALARRLGAPAADDPLPRGTGPAPVTAALREAWLGDQLAGTALWTVPTLVRVTGPLDEAVLRRALDALVERHDALRTAVTGPDTAVVVPPYPVPLEVSTDPAAADRLARTPLDLATGRVLRALLLRRSAGEAELLLHLHHAASDGLSYRALVTDLATVHTALSTGDPLPPPPAVSYADARRFVAGRATGSAARWRERLAGGPPASAAPVGSGSAAAGEWAGARVALPVDPALAGRVGAFVRDRAAGGASAFAVALAACAVRAHRETGATDLVVSAPMSTRDHPDLEGVVGLLHEAVPVRCDLTGDPTFGALVERLAAAATADRAAGAPAHADERLLRAAGAAQVRPARLVLAMQRAEPPVADGGRTWTYLRELDNGGAKADCTLFWEADMPVPQLSAEYAAQVLTAGEAEAFLRQVVTIVEAGLADPDRPVSRLPLLDEADAARVAALSGADTVDLAGPDPLAAVLDAARRAPAAVALDCPEAGPVTYGQLVAGAALVARALPGTGAGPAAPVAVAAPRSARQVAALLGVWLAGRAYLPLDVTHPPARLRGLLADSGVATVVAGAGCPDLPGTRVELAAVLAGPPAGWRADPPAAPTDPDRPAYRLYTSGSTGQPKGVTVPHRALGSFLRAIGRLVPLGPADVVPFLTTPSFDISGLEVWGPLAAGGTVRVVDEDTVRDGAALGRRLAGCTVAQLTPTGWQILLSGGWAGDPAVRALVGGEVLPPVLAEQLVKLTGQLWNVYGPTETTIWSAAHLVGPGDVAGRSVPVGRPLPNTVLHVVDAGGRPLPPGAVGEIVIGGAAVADGYHARDELTAQRFGPHPELPRGAAPDRWYRTGDRGRWLPDGTLECLGRSDGQVKVRGVRVELGEVEAALARVPGVAACAVTLDRAGTPAARLVGHLVLTPAGDAAAVAERLRAALPAAYVPEVWTTLPALPRTPNGKVDRAALPAPEDTGRAAEPPASELEQIVADIWAEVLEVPEVGRLDSFLALGGHSLTATRVAALLRDDLDLDVPVRLLFEHPRLCDLAAALDERLGDA